MKELSGNVYENKGSVFHSPGQSGNVVENKDTYEFKAGMLLKIQVVSVSQVAGGNWRLVWSKVV